MGAKKNVDMSSTTNKIKVLTQNAQADNPTEEKAEEKKILKRAKRIRGKKYIAGKSLVDRTKEYDVFAAVELVKRSSYAKFDATITADINVKEVGEQAKLTLPNPTGKTVRVAIADEKLLTEIEAGNLDFDVLLAPPSLMPKLVKLAPVLGPKGLMPNPKNGTLTDKPEAKKKELEGGMLVLKTERKAPIIHLVVGKVSMETKALVENINALIEALGPKLLKLTLSATMGPGVKVKTK